MGPRFVERGYTQDFGHAFLNRTHFRACSRFLVEFRLASSAGPWRKKIEEEYRRIAVKPKSADDYFALRATVGQPRLEA